MITQINSPPIQQHSSISDIIHRLKTAFRHSDYFQAVEELTLREANLTQKISNLMTQNKILVAELEAKDAKLGVLETELGLTKEAFGRCEWLLAYTRLLENQEEALRTKYEEDREAFVAELERLRRGLEERDEELRRRAEEARTATSVGELGRENEGFMAEKAECAECVRRLKGEIDDDGVVGVRGMKTYVQFLWERKVEVEGKMAELEGEKVRLEASLEEMRAVEQEKEGKIKELMNKVEELERKKMEDSDERFGALKNQVIQTLKETDEEILELEMVGGDFKGENTKMLGGMNQAIDIATVNNTKILELQDEKRVLEVENTRLLARLNKIENFLKLDGDAIASCFGVVEKDAKFSCSEIRKLLGYLE